MNDSDDIEVEVTFLAETSRGRARPKRTGYRPQFAYGGRDWDGVYTFPDADEVHPGHIVRAYISFLSPAEHLGKVAPGMPFQVREGRVVVGFGTVTRIVNLAANARRLCGQGDLVGPSREDGE